MLHFLTQVLHKFKCVCIIIIFIVIRVHMRILTAFLNVELFSKCVC